MMNRDAQGRLVLTATELAACLGFHLPYATGGELLTEVEIAERLDISDRQVRSLAKRGLPRVKQPGSPKWMYPALDAFHWWNVYASRTGVYRQGAGSPVRRLSLRDARAVLMRENIERAPREYTHLPLALARLAAPIDGDDWPSTVIVPKGVADALTEKIVASVA